MFKKIIIPVLATLILLVGGVSAKSLWEYGSFNERAGKAVKCGIIDNIDQYRGSLEQNVQLIKCYGFNKEAEYMQVLKDPWSQQELSGWYEFGATTGQRPSDFKTTLGESLSGTASTTEEITLSSVTTIDDHALTSADIGDFMCFKINPGASNRELICCSGGISGTTLQDCTRGYNFSDGLTTAARAKSHSPGETVIISNDDLYLATQYPSKDDDETITGTWAYGSTTAISRIQIGDGASTYDKRIYDYNGDTNMPFLSYDESENTWVYSNDGVSSTAIGSGASTYTAQAPIDITSSVVSLNTSTYWFLLEGTNNDLALGTTSSYGIYDLWNDRYNTTTTKPLDFTFSDDLTVSGSATTSGSFTFTNELCDGTYCRDSVFGKYYYASSSHSQAGTTVENVATTTIARGDMGTTGVLRFRFNGKFDRAGGGTLTFTVKFGDSDILVWSTSNDEEGIWIEGTISNDENASSQLVEYFGFDGAPGTSTATTSAFSIAQNTANATAFYITAVSNNGSDAFELNTFQVELIKK